MRQRCEQHIWADPETFLRSPEQAAAVLRGLEIPKIDTYLDALGDRGGLDLDALQRFSRNTLVSMNGEEHLQTRRVLAPFFSRAGLACWRPLFVEASSSAADTLAQSATPDLVKDFTTPLFLKLLPKVLGMKICDEEAHFRAIETLQRITEPYLSVTTLRSMNAAVALLVSCCPEPDDSDQGETRGDSPEGLLQYLYRRQADLPDDLDPRYLVVGLLAGANSATQSLAFALYGLLTGPTHQWPDAAKPDWAARQTQTVLGLYQSTRTLVRVAPQPAEVAGCPYEKGQTAVVDIVGANACLRAQSGDAAAHMSFGSGHHKCPGSFLCEILIETAIPTLARRFPKLVVVKDRCRFVVTPMMQAPVALPCDIAQTSGRVSARLVDIRDMPIARQLLRDDASFAPPPMPDHLTALSDKSGRDFGTAIQIDRHLEELIARCSGPKYIYRVARHDANIGELTLKAGDTARLVVHGLNQQTVAGAGHVSFGQGLHRCVGSGLSRMAIRLAVPALFTRFPSVSLVAQAQKYFTSTQTVALNTPPCPLHPH